MFVATFADFDEAFQVQISMEAELEFSSQSNNSLLILEESIETIKKICQELKLKLKLQNNYCLLPFPKAERECLSSNYPCIYVACLSAYNSGYHHGMWIDAGRETDEIQDDIDWMLSWSPVRDTEECEEWAIHDYENFQGIKLTEYENTEIVSELALALKEYGKAFALFIENEIFGDISEAIERFPDAYYGEYKDEEDFAYELISQCGYIDEKHPLYYYIDYERYARDLELGGDFYYIKSAHEEVHVFTNS